MARQIVVWPLVAVTILALAALNYFPDLPTAASGAFLAALLVIWIAVIWGLRSHRLTVRRRRLTQGEGGARQAVQVEARPATAPAGVRKALLSHPLFSYFSLAYAIKWIILIPYTLAAWGVIAGDWTGAFILATFGPFVAGVLMVDLTEGRPGLSRLKSSIRQWRLGWRWLLFLFAGVPALVMVGVVMQPGALTGFLGVSPVLLVSYPLTYALVWFGGGGVNEEVGWRGFALPRMQTKYGPLWGTLALGVIHCFWHLEEFLTPAQGGGPGTGWTPFLVDLPLFLVLVVSFNIVMTWIFNRTRGSLFAAVSAHASVDTPQAALLPLFPAVGMTSLVLGSSLGLGAVALALLVLTHGRLGYRQGR